MSLWSCTFVNACDADISIVVPVANSLTFIVTMLVGQFMGESKGNLCKFNDFGQYARNLSCLLMLVLDTYGGVGLVVAGAAVALLTDKPIVSVT